MQQNENCRLSERDNRIVAQVRVGPGIRNEAVLTTVRCRYGGCAYRTALNTGDIRSSDTMGIAAWFIDTDYNEESFFVRYA